MLIQLEEKQGNSQFFQQKNESHLPSTLIIDRKKTIVDNDGSLYKINQCSDPPLSAGNVTYKPFENHLSRKEADEYRAKNCSWFVLKPLL